MDVAATTQPVPSQITDEIGSQLPWPVIRRLPASGGVREVGDATICVASKLRDLGRRERVGFAAAEGIGRVELEG
jgi:hypothetical protein